MPRRYTLEHQKKTAEHFRNIEANAARLVQPRIMAIYASSDVEAEQIATGFLVSYGGRTILLTAKHALYGEAGNEDPMKKAIFAKGRLKSINELKSHNLVADPQNDLVALYADEIAADQCFPASALCQNKEKLSLITIVGFLARDFKRKRKVSLHPSPYAYTNKYRDCGGGYVGLLYPKGLNRDTGSGKKVMAPRPNGLSGCPMVNSIALLRGKVSVVGLFTDQRDGVAFGEASDKLHALLDLSCQDR